MLQHAAIGLHSLSAPYVLTCVPHAHTVAHPALPLLPRPTNPHHVQTLAPCHAAYSFYFCCHAQEHVQLRAPAVPEPEEDYSESDGDGIAELPPGFVCVQCNIIAMLAEVTKMVEHIGSNKLNYCCRVGLVELATTAIMHLQLFGIDNPCGTDHDMAMFRQMMDRLVEVRASVAARGSGVGASEAARGSGADSAMDEGMAA